MGVKDRRDVIPNKSATKEEIKRNNVARKMLMEENKRLRIERQCALKTKRDMAMKAREEKAKEIEKMKHEKNNLAVWRE